MHLYLGTARSLGDHGTGSPTWYSHSMSPHLSPSIDMNSCHVVVLGLNHCPGNWASRCIHGVYTGANWPSLLCFFPNIMRICKVLHSHNTDINMNFKMITKRNQWVLEWSCVRTKKLNGRGARTSTISHAKCFSTVHRANPPPPVESDQETVKKTFEYIRYGGGSSIHWHWCVSYW